MDPGDKRSGLKPGAGEPLISYSQNGEDIRLWRVLSDVEGGFYVDVGAAHPSEGSVTRLFCDRGWTGMNVEPSPYFERLVAERTGDINLRVAVGAEDEDDVPFFVAHPDIGLSTLDPTSLRSLPGSVDDIQEITVSKRRLVTILQEHASGRVIHFMKVDAEGAEHEVLASSDWDAFRPLILVVKAVKPWSKVPTHEKWEPILVEAGYLFAAFDGINRFYVESAHSELVEPLAYPLSPLDVYTPTDVHHKRVEKRRLEAELGEMQRQLLDARAQLATEYDKVTRLSAELNEAEAFLQQVYGSSTWRAGRMLAAFARPGLTVARAYGPSAVRVARAAKRFVPHRPRNPILAYDEAVAPEQPWHFPSRSHGPERRAEGRLGELIECVGAPERQLDDESTEALERALVRTNWTEDGVLLSWGFSWEERQAIVEADAVACLFRHSDPGGSPRSPLAGGSAAEVVVDARSLQDPAYSARGIGNHGRVVVAAARAAAARHRLVFLTSAELPPLPCGIVEETDEVLATPYPLRDREVALFVELSPMTASVAPTAPLLARPDCRTAAAVYDFVPTDYPDAYLRSEAAVLTNRLRLEALRHYDLLLPISTSTADACRRYLSSEVSTEVTGVADTLGDAPPGPRIVDAPYALIPAGSDPRKNIPVGLAAIALHGGKRRSRRLRAVVTGWLRPADAEALLKLGESLGLRRDDLKLLDHVEPAALASLYAHADVVIVPSFAEGFSIPVVQAVRRGAPVVASDIPSHRELLQNDPCLVPPRDVEALARAIAEVGADRERVIERQRDAVGLVGEPVEVQSRVEWALSRLLREPRTPRERTVLRRTRPRLAVVSPLPPQHTGVADYTAYTLQGVEQYADVEAYSAAEVLDRRAFTTKRLSAAPYLDRRFDRVVSVVGNSYFHLPILDFLASYGSATVAHDTRMAELYVLDRGDAWTAKLLSTESRSVTAGEIASLLHDLDDLPSTGYATIVQQSSPLIVHGRSLADRIFLETGIRPDLVPFVPYNFPPLPAVRAEEIHAARRALGLNETTYHIATFGIVDRRTKAVDLIVGAISWLQGWGHPIHLHVVGEIAPLEYEALAGIAKRLGIASHVTVYGRVTHDMLFQFLQAVDVAVQLRTSKLLSISGAVADCIAFGVPTVATREIVQELEAPEYCECVPARASTLLVAESVEKVLRCRRTNSDAIEDLRRAYLENRSVDVYARRLLDALGLPVA